MPGGAVAVVKDGRLILARGYGWADVESHEPVAPDSLFRIASLSKSLTAAAILKLVEDHRLGLDDRVFPLLAMGPARDPRLARITVRNLLQHTGGWDRDQTFDPMFRSLEIARNRAVDTAEIAAREAVEASRIAQEKRLAAERIAADQETRARDIAREPGGAVHFGK